MRYSNPRLLYFTYLLYLFCTCVMRALVPLNVLAVTRFVSDS